MRSICKIKIIDSLDIRRKIDEEAYTLSQADLFDWAIRCAKHILSLTDITFEENESLRNGLAISESWKLGKVTTAEVRKAAFAIHKSARECDNELGKTALRVWGQALSVAHMSAHAMVGADYAIKVVQKRYKNNISKIEEERLWQLETILEYKSKR